MKILLDLEIRRYFLLLIKLVYSSSNFIISNLRTLYKSSYIQDHLQLVSSKKNL